MGAVGRSLAQLAGESGALGASGKKADAGTREKTRVRKQRSGFPGLANVPGYWRCPLSLGFLGA